MQDSLKCAKAAIGKTTPIASITTGRASNEDIIF